MKILVAEFEIMEVAINILDHDILSKALSPKNILTDVIIGICNEEGRVESIATVFALL